MDALIRQITRISLRSVQHIPTINGLCIRSPFHTSATVSESSNPNGPRNWLKYNSKVFSPQKPGEEKRPAFVCHMRSNIKYSPWKMWYIASMIRGMSIENALQQLEYVNKKGAVEVREVLLEAQKLAVEEHNVEFKSNLWVAESFCTKGMVFKGIRRHARMRRGIIEYFHCHYFVRLEEGSPPEHFYSDKIPKSTETHLTEWMNEMRQRRIPGSL